MLNPRILAIEKFRLKYPSGDIKLEILSKILNVRVFDHVTYLLSLLFFLINLACLNFSQG